MPTRKNTSAGRWGVILQLLHAVSARGRGVVLTRASPTPSAKRPVKWSSCDDLWIKYVSQNPENPLPDAEQELNLILANSPFKPHGVGTSRKQIKVTEDCRPSVLVIQELAHEDVY